MLTACKLRAVSFLVVVSCFSLVAHAQYRTAIQGVVTDTSGAVVQGAKLTLTNPATGEKQVRISDGAGVYNFNALPAGARFNLEVTKDGFQKKFGSIAQSVGKSTNLNAEAKMKPGKERPASSCSRSKASAQELH